MAEMLNAVASLLWPLILLLLLLLFRTPLREVVRSAREREISLEIGGQRVTLGVLNRAQNEAIADLRKQVSALREALGEASGQVGSPAVAAVPDEEPAPLRVLWVDDHPENNVLEIAQLQDNGVRVDSATSTREGLELFATNRYRLVVTDMARAEVVDAGVRLATALRELDPTVPIVVYCGARAKRTLGARAIAAGANAVTNSPWELTEHFRKLALL
ncbi:CheY-like chemotaxis protein [Saccharothrix coeruleofusca]|uniref:response regulator n=1 Tax=Saccharothrix coeruleofusca TaxID=33919 RepID=UPI001AE50EC8|nr:response regulator [Saccharothrix coeruleofusca]MBP2334148.1 CheY-like chemotaxis protein [Saccharothrix coeruleofusca]